MDSTRKIKVLIMIGIKEIYEIACCIKKLVEENDELK